MAVKSGRERERERETETERELFSVVIVVKIINPPVCNVSQSSVVPRCGRMVGFNASNYHGVQAVQSGQRCAVAMWYTLDPEHREQAHDSLRRVLPSLEAETKTRDEL